MIEVVGVKKKFRRKKVLENITFNVKKGEITALLGLNGVGKSTLLKIIMGLVKQDEGEVLFNGEKLNYKTYENIAFVPDVLNTYGDMKIKDAFEYMSMMYEKWDMDKAYEMLKDFKLTDDLKINKLSKGNIARVKLILGFARHPEYLLLDEPFSGIDIFTREKFIESLIGYMDNDIGILLTTHELKEVENIVDKVVFLSDGNIKIEFYVEDVRENEGLSMVEKIREVHEGE
ncbi:ABC transporter ATP-binding protein [Clostridium perfringens]|jgi:ABC-2 type transport system ATP-binding protein|uniref:ABC transporter n=4 Tax=Clostridium perfringens TaxID=1502 RepID=A0A2X3A5Y4_CLOPF|nr:MULTISPECIES: ABC transporter ATP-binding protein [Clostridium]WEV15449.1 ABC transporter ATP-binding protein [Clostridium perfringens D]ASY52298.1 multidrug ABC transporter ATP-binding protein [Clostridium perfringens]AWS26829.1 ABC transporter ATP-binding protein [Clostridium perfringens]AXH53232.1 ABC transporter ATP-binding protein [Clostridium perfringens]EDS80267.1 ABC transporter, ATP-binding protein [Clostridium perfringens C str. JGS1495]